MTVSGDKKEKKHKNSEKPFFKNRKNRLGFSFIQRYIAYLCVQTLTDKFIMIMATPIRETPILKGKDARRFDRAMKNVKPMTEEQKKRIRSEAEAFTNEVTIKI